ncbi:MAG TPA: gamma-glutamylcyclotransferase family protein [Halomonas sp.]|nr:gamma-glutamylcyclotransferase family protein [Halomonas sp.]
MQSRYVRLGLLLAPLTIPAWLWLTMLSPWTYQRPDHLPPVDAGSQAVFVYGTLTCAPVRWLVYGRAGDPEPAVLPGFERQGLDLQPKNDGRVRGLVLDVSGTELIRLDRYERLGVRYRRIQVQLASGQQAWVYVRLKE